MGLRTVLCIDDDVDDLESIREALVSHGEPFQMVEAHNGEEALAYLLEAVEKGSLPSLIIMDINMPKMDGRKTVQHIKSEQKLRDIPLVVFTTSSGKADQEYFDGFGVRYLTKPSYFLDFTHTVKNILNNYPAE
jgi:CheY-like chemotaxis protein